MQKLFVSGQTCLPTGRYVMLRQFAIARVAFNLLVFAHANSLLMAISYIRLFWRKVRKVFSKLYYQYQKKRTKKISVSPLIAS